MSARPVGPARSEAKTVATSAQLLPNLSGLSTGANGAGKRPRTEPSQQPPTGPPPLPEVHPTDGYDGTLAGLWMRFDNVMALFEDGGVLRSTSCNTTTFYEQQKATNELLGQIGQLQVAPTKEGSFNKFIPLSDGPFLNGLLEKLPYTDRLVFERMAFGVRLTNDLDLLYPDSSDFYAKLERQFSEVWISMQAAMGGIAPRILAVGLVEETMGNSSIKQVVSVIEKGVDLGAFVDRYNLPRGLDKSEFYQRGLADSEALANAYERAAEMHLLLTDTKPKNMVKFEDGRVCFIDFDAKYSAFVGAEVDSLCLEFVNSALFLSAMDCSSGPGEHNVMSGLSYALRKRMRNVLIPYAEVRMRDTDSSLCSTLLGLTLPGVKEVGWLGDSERLDTTAIAEHILFRAKHYTTFSSACVQRPKKGEVGVFLMIANAACDSLASTLDAPFVTAVAEPMDSDSGDECDTPFVR